MFVGTYGLFANLMSLITTVGKHLLGNDTGGKMFVEHLRAFSPRIHDDDDEYIIFIDLRDYIYRYVDKFIDTKLSHDRAGSVMR